MPFDNRHTVAARRSVLPAMGGESRTFIKGVSLGVVLAVVSGIVIVPALFAGRDRIPFPAPIAPAPAVPAATPAPLPSPPAIPIPPAAAPSPAAPIPAAAATVSPQPVAPAPVIVASAGPVAPVVASSAPPPPAATSASARVATVDPQPAPATPAPRPAASQPAATQPAVAAVSPTGSLEPDAADSRDAKPQAQNPDSRPRHRHRRHYARQQQWGIFGLFNFSRSPSWRSQHRRRTAWDR